MTESKYEHLYHSESRREDVTLESMGTRHLVNAYKKLRDASNADDFAALLVCMSQEIAARGLNLEEV